MGELKGFFVDPQDQSVPLSNPLHRPLSHVFVGFFGKQGALGLKARSGLIRVQTFLFLNLRLVFF